MPDCLTANILVVLLFVHIAIVVVAVVGVAVVGVAAVADYVKVISTQKSHDILSDSR